MAPEVCGPSVTPRGNRNPAPIRKPDRPPNQRGQVMVFGQVLSTSRGLPCYIGACILRHCDDRSRFRLYGDLRRRRGNRESLVLCLPGIADYQPCGWWIASRAPSRIVRRTLLGLTIDATQPQIRLTRSVLPESLRHVRIQRLRVGEAIVDLALEHRSNDVGIELLRRKGNIEIVVVKRSFRVSDNQLLWISISGPMMG